MPIDEELTLRLAVESDLPQVADLFIASRSGAAPAMPAINAPIDVVRAHIQGWDLGAREVWLAEDALGLVGFATLTGTWLESLYVAPDRQGTGVGTALLELAMALRPAGFGLWVFASNSPARGFYRRHGLIELEHTDGSANSEHEPDIRMAWPGLDPMSYLRGQIDEVDAHLAELLARRFALTAAVQGQKAALGGPGGHAGRDPLREQAIVERMVNHVPGLEAERVASIMDAVIGESLTAWEDLQR
ncbi:MAG TPA: GNAT family N-acetyltransferase [Marmoricola sp.]|nr:GNAT family N-acetyltransferase [Marmoricola sp.]